MVVASPRDCTPVSVERSTRDSAPSKSMNRTAALSGTNCHTKTLTSVSPTSMMRGSLSPLRDCVTRTLARPSVSLSSRSE
ncbi:Uncharacterised protein [Mycobacterium tuberculosis]|nr:Uncharacterised protein [Mycobacterium tuberculosis]